MSETKEVTTKAGKATIRDMILRNRAAFAEVIPNHVSVDRLLRVTSAAIMRSPDLMECTSESLMQSVMEAAQLGLEPTGRWGGAHLVAFNVKVKERGKPDRWEKRATVIYDYRGLAQVARRSGEIATLAAEVVRENDRFDYSLGFSPDLRHVPALDDRGKPICAWAAATLKDGSRYLKIMSVADVESIRQRSKAKDFGPWVTDWEAMASKTVLKKLLNLLPFSVELADALAADDRNNPVEVAVRTARSGVAALSRLSGEPQAAIAESPEDAPTAEPEFSQPGDEDDAAHRIELAEVLLARMAELNAGQRTALLRAAGATTLPHGWTVAEVAELPASVLAAALKASA